MVQFHFIDVNQVGVYLQQIYLFPSSELAVSHKEYLCHMYLLNLEDCRIIFEYAAFSFSYKAILALVLTF